MRNHFGTARNECLVQRTRGNAEKTIQIGNSALLSDLVLRQGNGLARPREDFHTEIDE
jgi:hypothetical protein